MDKTQLTTVQISKVALAVLRRMAETDMRSTAAEMKWLIAEELHRRNPDIEQVTELPGPEGADRPLLVNVKK